MIVLAVVLGTTPPLFFSNLTLSDKLLLIQFIPFYRASNFEGASLLGQ